MSAVTKCDICGTFYNEDKVTATTLKIDMHEYDPLNRDYDYKYIDCCPECTNKIKEFINVLYSGDRYSIYRKKEFIE